MYQHFLSLRFFFGFIAIVDVSLAQLPMAMLLWNWNLKLDFTLFLIYAFVCNPFSTCFLIQIFLPFTCSSLCDALLLEISFAEHGLCCHVFFLENRHDGTFCLIYPGLGRCFSHTYHVFRKIVQSSCIMYIFQEMF